MSESNPLTITISFNQYNDIYQRIDDLEAEVKRLQKAKKKSESMCQKLISENIILQKQLEEMKPSQGETADEKELDKNNKGKGKSVDHESTLSPVTELDAQLALETAILDCLTIEDRDGREPPKEKQLDLNAFQRSKKAPNTRGSLQSVMAEENCGTKETRAPSAGSDGGVKIEQQSVAASTSQGSRRNRNKAYKKKDQLTQA
ncbi:hypothetical protein DFH27DRAFT_652064 [Peziza echinospora]|nr:hypothetical protein DFH27DRAFT_652064 [Peziza echinospora]